jgi:hypothetical protein
VSDSISSFFPRGKREIEDKKNERNSILFVIDLVAVARKENKEGGAGGKYKDNKKVRYDKIICDMSNKRKKKKERECGEGSNFVGIS